MESRINSGTAHIKLQVESHSIIFILYKYATEITVWQLYAFQKPKEKNGNVLKLRQRKKLLPGFCMPYVGGRGLKKGERKAYIFE